MVIIMQYTLLEYSFAKKTMFPLNVQIYSQNLAILVN